MPTLLLEIGCEELPAAACREAGRQLPELVRRELGVEPSRVFISPRRLAFLVDELPDLSERAWVKGPPVSAPAQAREGFARRYGVSPDGAHAASRLPRHREGRSDLGIGSSAIVRGLSFSRTMVWRAGGLRFPRPVRWLLAKLDSETVEFEVEGLASGSVTFGHRFTHGEIEVPDAGAYLGLLRNADVEPDAAERRRLILEGLDAIGGWSDPMGKLDEVVYMVESVNVLEAEFDERFLQLPRRVIETAMQSHQRYFPLGGNRFAFVANGGDPELVTAGNRQVLENRLDDADFTFRRDRERGIEELAKQLGSITFFQGAGSFADKTDRLVDLVRKLGGGEASLEAARLAKADQASELVREYPDLEGHIGAEYARLAGYPEAVCLAIDEQYLPDGRMRRCRRRRRARCSPRRTRSTRSTSRSASATSRPARATLMGCAGRRSASAGSPTRAACRFPATCCPRRCAILSRSGLSRCSRCPSSSCARPGPPRCRTSAVSRGSQASSPRCPTSSSARSTRSTPGPRIAKDAEGRGRWGAAR